MSLIRLTLGPALATGSLTGSNYSVDVQRPTWSVTPSSAGTGILGID
jgi:hypothetical protein